ncbi:MULTISPECIES: class F sortase [Streptomyces]|uniref:Sortase n=2 Tax=Streptomyces TaxID=1883 RepID=A0A100Y329_9ACTN|nr:MULTISPECIES: class F sortase [Streptomyces]KUH36799.1 sortase [Streptomyces kanasensis]UUS31243.1 class F sortase [Streptomyces changanensis]
MIWALVLVLMWLWGKEVTAGQGGLSAPTTGDVAAVGRPRGVPLPPPHEPVGPARPLRLDVPSLGVESPVVPRGLEETGAVEPPPFQMPGTVGWYAAGTRPGERGAALLVGHVDTETGPAVFHHLRTVRPGALVRVGRADGSVAEFTVEDVRVLSRHGFDPHQAYGPRDPSRAELRLITCGGTFDRATQTYTANVVVSAYLTAVR